MSDGEGWTVSGNKAATAVTHDPTSRGLMNRYVYGTSSYADNFWIHEWL